MGFKEDANEFGDKLGEFMKAHRVLGPAAGGFALGCAVGAVMPGGFVVALAVLAVALLALAVWAKHN